MLLGEERYPGGVFLCNELLQILIFLDALRLIRNCSGGGHALHGIFILIIQTPELGIGIIPEEGEHKVIRIVEIRRPRRLITAQFSIVLLILNGGIIHRLHRAFHTDLLPHGRGNFQQILSRLIVLRGKIQLQIKPVRITGIL